MSTGYASIYLENEKCVGCTKCMQRCPTEAIRIRGGKASILQERCVDCGECIRVCPHHAMKARVDSLSDVLGKYKYTIALPAQALYGQFPGGPALPFWKDCCASGLTAYLRSPPPRRSCPP